ncbi:methyl-accepting chemotaxis protein [Lederbergia graminis]|uniref:Methyl-accepting chemotaxis protein n=1 Tax=Lederbergia graminis TaxID=735518 RepID=A0ABW0LML3_9BACI
MKIRTKLGLVVGIFVIALLISGGLAIYLFKETEKAFSEMEKYRTVQLTMKTIQYRFTGISNDERGFLLTGDKEFATGLQEKITDIEQHLTELKNVQLDNSSKNSIHNISESLQTYFNKNKQMLKADKTEQALHIHMEEQRDIRKELVDPTIHTFIDEVSKTIEEKEISLQETEKFSTAILYLVIAISIILGVTFSLLIIRSINRPIAMMNTRLKEIAEGESDLTQSITIKTKDELGEIAASFNAMLAKLRSLIQHIVVHGEHVAAASEQLAASSEETTKATEQIVANVQEVAAGSDQQVMSIQNTHQTIKELSTLVNKIAASSEIVSQSSVHAANKAVDGTISIHHITNYMDDINNTVQNLSGKIQSLGEKSNQIQDIITVITGIAEQTNLLALNAAIEAARAGEHGQGFAVVAEQVRKLAEQSSVSAKQITSLISNITTETEGTVQSMHDTTSKVANGIHFIQETGESFEQIEHGIQGVTSQIQEVAGAVQQLTEHANEMINNMNTLADISEVTATSTQSMSASTEEQLATMEEITSSSYALTQQAEELQDLMRKFKV